MLHKVDKSFPDYSFAVSYSGANRNKKNIDKP